MYEWKIEKLRKNKRRNIAKNVLTRSKVGHIIVVRKKTHKSTLITTNPKNGVEPWGDFYLPHMKTFFAPPSYFQDLFFLVRF